MAMSIPYNYQALKLKKQKFYCKIDEQSLALMLMELMQTLFISLEF